MSAIYPRSVLISSLVVVIALAACSSSGSSAASSPSTTSTGSTQSAAPSATDSTAEACVDDETLALLEDNLDDLGALSESDLDHVAAQMSEVELTGESPEARFRDQVVDAIETGDFTGIGMIPVLSGEVDLGAFGC